MPISVAASEIHARVYACRVSLEHLLDKADTLEELTPIERRDESKAADKVRHRGLFGRLMLAFGADGILDRPAACAQGCIQLLAQLGRGRPVLPRTLEQSS